MKGILINLIPYVAVPQDTGHQSFTRRELSDPRSSVYPGGIPSFSDEPNQKSRNAKNATLEQLLIFSPFFVITSNFKSVTTFF